MAVRTFGAASVKLVVAAYRNNGRIGQVYEGRSEFSFLVHQVHPQKVGGPNVHTLNELQRKFTSCYRRVIVSGGLKKAQIKWL